MTFRWRGRDKYKRALCVIETLAPLGPGPTDIVWKTKRSKAARAVAELQLAPDVGPPYDLNRQMVLFGWACSYDAYFQEEAEAQGASRAIWSVNFKHPTVFRKEKK